MPSAVLKGFFTTVLFGAVAAGDELEEFRKSPAVQELLRNAGAKVHDASGRRFVAYAMVRSTM